MRSDPIEIRYGPGGFGREFALGLLAFAVWIPVYVWNELSPWAFVILGGVGVLAAVSLVRRHRRIARDRPLILTVSDEGLTRHGLDGVTWALSWEDIRSISGGGRATELFGLGRRLDPQTHGETKVKISLWRARLEAPDPRLDPNPNGPRSGP